MDFEHDDLDYRIVSNRWEGIGVVIFSNFSRENQGKREPSLTMTVRKSLHPSVRLSLET